VAKQANGAALVQMVKQSFLVTAGLRQETERNGRFFSVDGGLSERTYAAGRIPGGFFKREGRAREKEILVSPSYRTAPSGRCFSEYLRFEVQITSLALSADGQHETDIPGHAGRQCGAGHVRHPLERPHRRGARGACQRRLSC